MQKLKSQLEKKQKKLQLTIALRNKNKRTRKAKDDSAVQEKMKQESAKTEIVKKTTSPLDVDDDAPLLRKIYPTMSIRNWFVVNAIKRRKKLKMKKIMKNREKNKGSLSNPNESKNDSNVNYDPPEGAHNRVGRWTNTELTKLKLAMSIFGD